ncbi:hypothetical protein TWF173_004559 [Orbilia oligospora]|nr:hypothetical protein TWF173_004559 [Orbilia oligospora]
MSHLQASKLKVLRVWGFNDVTSPSGVYFQLFSGSSPTINTGSNGLQRLDAIVASAEKYGIKLIIPFVNYWDDYGGMKVYANYYGVSKNAFYTDSRVISQYKQYINALVSRYRNSKAIFAWELANEPRCNGCPTSTITSWATSISQYIKSLDPNHLVTLGDEGWFNGGGDGSYPYSGGEGIDFVKNLAISTLDFGTAHLYPGHWSKSDSWGNTWIQEHASAATSAGKPYILEEYGVTSNRGSVYGSWYNTILGSETAGDMYWQFGETLSSGQTHNDGFTIYYSSSEFNSLVGPHANAMHVNNSDDECAVSFLDIYSSGDPRIYAEDAQALTCVEYLCQTWPSTGKYIIELVKDVIDESEILHTRTLPDNTALIAYFRESSELVVEAVGTKDSVAEIGQQLAWLCTALSPSPLETGVVAVVPLIKNSQSLNSRERGTTTPPTDSRGPAHANSNLPTFSFRLHFSAEEREQNTIPLNGQCWHNMFRNPMVVKGYPIPWRFNLKTKLEVPLKIMAGLV